MEQEIGQLVEEMLFAGNFLAKAQHVFESFIKRRPRSRLTVHGHPEKRALQSASAINVKPLLLSHRWPGRLTTPFMAQSTL